MRHRRFKRRLKLSKKSSKRVFRKGLRVHRKNSSIRQVDRFINSRSRKSGGGFSLRRGFGARSGRYNKFNKF